MPLGSIVTSYLAELYPTDPIAPQVIGDFARTLPPNPIKGAAVSAFAHSFPTDPVHPGAIGHQLSAFIQILVRPDVGLGDMF